MKIQNISNYRRYVVGYHIVTFLMVLIVIIGTIRNLIVTKSSDLYPSVLLVLISVILLFLFYYSRVFALKAQDRAIKVEECLRYYILTGKPLSTEINIRQIIALRFASDEEFVDLVDKTINGNLSENEIKNSIKNWKPDTYRV